MRLYRVSCNNTLNTATRINYSADGSAKQAHDDADAGRYAPHYSQLPGLPIANSGTFSIHSWSRNPERLKRRATVSG